MAIIVDAAEPRAHPGAIHRLDLNTQPVPHDLARCSSHGLGLAEALELGKVLDQLPKR
jgi:hydrogenase maturation protease